MSTDNKKIGNELQFIEEKTKQRQSAINLLAECKKRELSDECYMVRINRTTTLIVNKKRKTELDSQSGINR